MNLCLHPVWICNATTGIGEIPGEDSTISASQTEVVIIILTDVLFMFNAERIQSLALSLCSLIDFVIFIFLLLILWFLYVALFGPLVV